MSDNEEDDEDDPLIITFRRSPESPEVTRNRALARLRHRNPLPQHRQWHKIFENKPRVFAANNHSYQQDNRINRDVNTEVERFLRQYPNFNVNDISDNVDQLTLQSMNGFKTALFWAAHDSNLELTQLLLVQGANMDDYINPKEPVAPIPVALWQEEITVNQKAIVELLVRRHGNIKRDLNRVDIYSYSLFLACLHNFKDMIILLVEHGANVNYQDTDHDGTLLTYGLPSEEIIELLLQYGSDPTRPGNMPDYGNIFYMSSIRYYAEVIQDLNILELFEKYNSNFESENDALSHTLEDTAAGYMTNIQCAKFLLSRIYNYKPYQFGDRLTAKDIVAYVQFCLWLSTIDTQKNVVKEISNSLFL